MVSAYLNGFLLSLSLILAVGAQNAFVLKQGLRGEFVLPIVAFCVVSDAILMAMGVFGFAALMERLPAAAPFMIWFGAIFVFIYGVLSFRRAWQGGAALDPATAPKGSLRAAMMFCFAVTWLNPHAYLDTVFLVGSVASRFVDATVAFWVGASSGSGLFFIALGFGARFLAPLMARPGAWRVLEFAIGVVMFVIAAGLIWSVI